MMLFGALWRRGHLMAKEIQFRGRDVDNDCNYRLHIPALRRYDH